MTKVSTPAPNTFSAAASAAGYLYQVRYALLRALRIADRRPGAEVSLELLDDVAFEEGDKPFELVQTKHSLQVTRQAALTASSPDLWKTIRVWSERLLEEPSLSEDIDLILITTATVPPTGIARLLRDGEERDAEKALCDLEVAASKIKNRDLEKAVRSFRRLSPELRVALVSAMRVVDGAGGVDDLRAELLDLVRFAAPRDRIGDLLSRLEGWWWDRAIKALVNRSFARIPVAEIRDRLDQLREEFHRSSLPVEYKEAKPTDQELLAYEERPFVEQLRLVGVGPRRIDFAKRDYYRAYSQRSAWVRKHLIFEDEVSSFENQLIEEWEPRFEGMRERLGQACHEDQARAEGNSLVAWVEHEARYPLRGVNERFLTIGSFHILSDSLRVGWHHYDFGSRVRRHADQMASEHATVVG